MREFHKSEKLDNVCYDIRGPVMEEAKRLESNGYRILKLNIGNPAPFGFDTPEEVIQDMIANLSKAQGYSDSQGVFAARKSVMHYSQRRGIEGVTIDDVYLGNGVSELISLATQALVNQGDEVLVPSPDYPLWTASVTLAGGNAVHYPCDEKAEWYPDLAALEKLITNRTKALVLINPNNPTGSVYPVEILEAVIELARKHELILFCDEIYDKIVYDGVEHVSPASLADDVFIVTLNGLSKVYRAAGFRAGWMILSGNKRIARDYIEGLNILSNMRLCSNVPAQYAIQTSLGGYQSINELIVPGGRLYEQREAAWGIIKDIPGLSCVKPKGALYLFPRIDTERFGIRDDEKFVLDFLREKHILLVQGRGFHWPRPDHFRIVFLPPADELERAMHALGEFLDGYRQS